MDAPSDLIAIIWHALFSSISSFVSRYLLIPSSSVAKRVTKNKSNLSVSSLSCGTSSSVSLQFGSFYIPTVASGLIHRDYNWTICSNTYMESLRCLGKLPFFHRIKQMAFLSSRSNQPNSLMAYISSLATATGLCRKVTTHILPPLRLWLSGFCRTQRLEHSHTASGL